jgi:hypothetical protein
MSNCNVTLQQVVNLTATHVDLMPLSGIGGYTNEPALSLCNDTIQELMTSPLAWKFNSIEMPSLILRPGKQDYVFAGSSAFTLGTRTMGAAIGLASNNAITVTGGLVTVNTLEAHLLSVGDTVYMLNNVATTGTTSVYNSVLLLTAAGTSMYMGGWVILSVTSTSFTFASTAGQNNGDVAGAPGISNFGWLSDATMFDVNSTSTPQSRRHLNAVRDLQLQSAGGDPTEVAVVRDNGDGTLKIRIVPVPASSVWAVDLVYQAKAITKTALSDTWAPFPDDLSFVYRQHLLARMYRYINSPRADVEYQKAQAASMKASGASDRETSDIGLYPESSLMDSGWGGLNY